MCGRFFFEGDLDEVIKRFNIEINRQQSLNRGEIFPSYDYPVIHNNNGNKIDIFKWGFSVPYIKSLIINARGETVDSKPMFKNLLTEKRCLIPANCYFEWLNEGNKKIKFKIFLNKHKLFYMAGLYGRFYKNDEAYTGFTIITKEAMPAIKKIHHRMPVILTMENTDIWLDPSNKDSNTLKGLLLEERIDDIVSQVV
ncbi:SOS response-associated peptidase [Alkaliphilus pronyensis]|nr:SOS response-associated peptidase [Alkaliphilus pronyensis]